MLTLQNTTQNEHGHVAAQRELTDIDVYTACANICCKDVIGVPRSPQEHILRDCGGTVGTLPQVSHTMLSASATTEPYDQPSLPMVEGLPW